LLKLACAVFTKHLFAVPIPVKRLDSNDSIPLRSSQTATM